MLRRSQHQTQIYIFGKRREETFNCCRCHDIIRACNEVKDTDRQPPGAFCIFDCGQTVEVAEILGGLELMS
jgi:hypothetical protein